MCYFVIGSYNTDETSLSVALAALKIRSKSMNFQNGHSGTTGVVAEDQITRQASPGEARAQGVVRTGPWLRSGLMWPLNRILLTWERPSARTQVISSCARSGWPRTSPRWSPPHRVSISLLTTLCSTYRMKISPGEVTVSSRVRNEPGDQELCLQGGSGSVCALVFEE